MRHTLSVLAVALLVSTAGCAAFGGGGGTDTTNGDEVVDVGNDSASASGVDQTVRLTVDEEAADSEWESLSVEYPRENFTVSSAQHENVSLGVDTDGDGELETEFDESHVSGVNNNAYSFDLEVDTDHALEAGDVVVVEYPAVDNPEEPGNYTVEVTLNEAQTTNTTISIE